MGLASALDDLSGGSAPFGIVPPMISAMLDQRIMLDPGRLYREEVPIDVVQGRHRPHKPFDVLAIVRTHVHIVQHEHLCLKQVQVVHFVLQSLLQLYDRPFDFGVTRQLPLFLDDSTSLPAANHVEVDPLQPRQTANQVLTVHLDGAAEKCNVLCLAILDVQRLRGFEQVVVQEQDLEGGELGQARRYRSEAVAGQVQLDEVDAEADGAELGLLQLGAGQDQQLQVLRLLDEVGDL